MAKNGREGKGAPKGIRRMYVGTTRECINAHPLRRRLFLMTLPFLIGGGRRGDEHYLSDGPFPAKPRFTSVGTVHGSCNFCGSSCPSQFPVFYLTEFGLFFPFLEKKASLSRPNLQVLPLCLFRSICGE